jgi:hypothetical protein
MRTQQHTTATQEPATTMYDLIPTTLTAEAELREVDAQVLAARALLYNASQLRDAAGVARINRLLEDDLYPRQDALRLHLR